MPRKEGQSTFIILLSEFSYPKTIFSSGTFFGLHVVSVHLPMDLSFMNMSNVLQNSGNKLAIKDNNKI